MTDPGLYLGLKQNTMKTQNEIIIGSIVHMANFIASRMMEAAFALAYEGELSDMKAYRAPQEYTKEGDETVLTYANLEIELLESLADEGVKKVVAAMNKVYNFQRIYLMINNLELIEVLEDDECEDLAYKTYMEFPLDFTADYDNQVSMETDNYYMYNLMIWRCIQMLSGRQTSFVEDKDYPLFSTQYYDFITEHTTSDDKNIALLYNLQRSLEIGMIGRMS